MDIPVLPGNLSDYLERLIPPRPPELEAMETEAQEMDFPIIGPVSGYLCYLVARMIGARRIFELGSGFGYSTAWFAKAVRENGGGEIHHVVWDDKLSLAARRHLAVLGYGEDILHFHVSEAVHALHETDGPFDLIFDDIEKENYPASLPVIAQKLRPGGVLIIDNMLWGGRIFKSEDKAASTEGIREMTTLLTDSSDWITSLIPVRDGVMIAYKR
jgi:caffeoyl-CoA O-methyltransferase